VQAVLHRCSLDDLADLQTISRGTFEETFREMNTPENLQVYLDGAFNRGKLSAELQNPGSSFYFLLVDGQLAGYLKVNQGDAQTDLHEADTLEVERIYLKSAYQGQGWGRWMLEQALEIARQAGKRAVWLGVWEKNTHAIAFYQRLGFQIVGTHAFVMGDDHQTDYIMLQEITLI
jgi:ribosomal protein S18 acetylase RimI-like enzyme